MTKNEDGLTALKNYIKDLFGWPGISGYIIGAGIGYSTTLVGKTLYDLLYHKMPYIIETYDFSALLQVPQPDVWPLVGKIALFCGIGGALLFTKCKRIGEKIVGKFLRW
jgi:hypothetical protein